MLFATRRLRNGTLILTSMAVVLAGFVPRPLAGQDVSLPSIELPPMPTPNLPLKTAGGTQVWTDHRNVHQWRLQQNALTGHWRVLDPDDIRRAWGDQEACLAALDEATSALETPPAEHVVVLMHGLMRSKHSMRHIAKRIQAMEHEPEVVAYSYASTRFGIAEHAAALRETIEHLPGQPRMSFVGHSMGNIVVRHAIHDWQTEGDRRGVLPRLESIVMLGPPNQGAAIARRLSAVGLFEFVTGAGGMELGPFWNALKDRLAEPPCPFAIIAGEVPTWVPKNPLVDGASDLVVSVEEARLPGATEFHTVKHPHSFLMDQEDVQELTLKFLAAQRP